MKTFNPSRVEAMAKSLHCIHSHSDDVDTYDAMQKIMTSCHAQLGSEVPISAIVFFDIAHNPELIIERVYQQWPHIQLVGCSSYGEFSAQYGMSDGSIQLILLCGNNINAEARCMTGEQVQQNIQTGCQSLLPDNKKPAVSLFFSEILKSKDIENIIDQLNALLPPGSALVGGIAADEYSFKNTLILCNQKILNQGCVLLNLYGDIACSVSVSLDWRLQGGTKGLATRSEGFTLFEVNDKPVLNFYAESGITPNTEIPLAVYDKEDNLLYMRAPILDYSHADPMEGIQYLGRVPEGMWVKVSAAEQQTLLNGVQSAVQKAFNKFPSYREPALGLFFSCASRRVFLGSRYDQEALNLRQALPKNIPSVGYFTFGEVAKLNLGDPVFFHNNSFVAAFIG